MARAAGARIELAAGDQAREAAAGEYAESADVPAATPVPSPSPRLDFGLWSHTLAAAHNRTHLLSRADTGYRPPKEKAAASRGRRRR